MSGTWSLSCVDPGSRLQACNSRTNWPSTEDKLHNMIYCIYWNTPALLKEIFVMQTESGSDWLSCIKQTLSSLGFANIRINPTSIHKGLFLAELEQRSRDQYVQIIMIQIFNS